MDRITEKQLQAAVNRINVATGSPTSYFAKRRKNGQRVTSKGHFCLSYAYGGASLHRTMNEGGGVTDVFRCGHVPKRELWGLVQAYLTALADVREGDVKVAKRRTIVRAETA